MELTGIQKWRDLDGDNTLALDWDLNEDSHVWEIGGFEGRWAQQIWDKFHCNITIFEPQLWAVERMQKRFEGIEKIEIRPYGLWTTYCSMNLGNYFTDGASIYSNKEPIHEVENLFVDIDTEIRKFGKEIDLTLINIEGAEYSLIHYMLYNGCIKNFKSFWCQFHPGLFENTLKNVGIKEVEDLLFENINKTHDMLWNCYPTAVAWRRR